MTIDRPENRFTYWFGVLFVLLALALIYLASFPSPINAYESDFIEVASKMISSGEWGIPRLLSGKVLYHSPPLSYWLSASGHWLLPGYWIGFRLFHIFFYLLGFVAFFQMVKLYLDVRTSFYSCCILACSVLLSWQMPMATPEGIAALFICGALFSFFHFLKTNQKNFLWLLYGSLALAFLSKGLIAIILPLIIMVLYLMFRIKMNGTHLKKLKSGKGILLVFLVGIPWYIYAAWTNNGEWIYHFFDTIHWQQAISGPPPVMEGAFYFPFLFIIFAILPFGFFLPKSFGYSWKIRQKKPLLLLSALGLLSVLIFFAFTETFHAHYLLPAIPFTAIIIAYQLSQMNGRPLSKMKFYIGVTGTALFAIITPVVLYFLLKENIAEGTFNLYFLLMLSLLPIGTIVGFVLWQNKRTDEGMAVLTITYLLFTLLLVQIAKSSEQLMAYIQLLIS